MKDYKRGPIIIKLEDYMNDRANVAKLVKKRFESMKTSSKKCRSFEQNIRKYNNVYMMSECDDVLKNDFKWLINFNLKEIPIYDIDKEVPGNKLLMGQKNSHRKKFVIKHKHGISLSDVIEQCLFIKDEATLKEISKWISDAFPCFKSKGCTWKNSVRKTLLSNPIFKKKKLKLGKCHLWGLDDIYLRETSCVEETVHQSVKQSVNEYNLTKPESTIDFKELSTTIQPIQENIVSEENALSTIDFNDISANTRQLHLPETWIESRELHDKHYVKDKDEALTECYEIPAEFQDENVESIEVQFLDENNMLIPIDFI